MAKRGSWSAVYDWMLELGLTASELLIYSRILSFSNSEAGGFIGKVDSLAEWGRCSLRQARRVLDNLIDRGLVRKSYIKTDIGTRIKYSVESDTMSQQSDTMSQQSDTMSLEGVTPCHSESDTMSQPTLYNKNIYNNTIIGGVNIDTSVEPPPPTVDEIDAYCRELENGIDAKRFHDYYTSRGWRWREGSITAPEKWKAVLRLWGKDEQKQTNKQTEYHGGSFDTDDFFEAALRQSYGDEIADGIINGG